MVNLLWLPASVLDKIEGYIDAHSHLALLLSSKAFYVQRGANFYRRFGHARHFHTGNFILRHTVQGSYLHSTDQLLRSGAPTQSEPPLTHIAVGRGDYRMLHLLLKHGQDPTTLDTDGRTALHMAVLFRSHHCLRALLKSGWFSVMERNGTWGGPQPRGLPTIDVACSSGDTALSYAVLQPDAFAVSALLRAGATYRTDMLVRAIERNSADIIKIFITAGISVDTICDDLGRTALMLAVQLGHEQTARALLNFGADCEKRDKNGWAIMHHAAAAGASDPMVILLYNRGLGAKVDVLDKKLRTPLHVLKFGAINTAYTMIHISHGALTALEEDSQGQTAYEVKRRENDKVACRWLESVCGVPDRVMMRRSGNTNFVMASGSGREGNLGRRERENDLWLPQYTEKRDEREVHSNGSLDRHHGCGGRHNGALRIQPKGSCPPSYSSHNR